MNNMDNNVTDVNNSNTDGRDMDMNNNNTVGLARSDPMKVQCDKSNRRPIQCVQCGGKVCPDPMKVQCGGNGCPMWGQPGAEPPQDPQRDRSPPSISIFADGIDRPQQASQAARGASVEAAQTEPEEASTQRPESPIAGLFDLGVPDADEPAAATQPLDECKIRLVAARPSIDLGCSSTQWDAFMISWARFAEISERRVGS